MKSPSGRLQLDRLLPEQPAKSRRRKADAG
jgi:hypothetical protein